MGRGITPAPRPSRCAPQTTRLEVCQLPPLRQTITPIEKLWKKIKQQDTQLPSLPTLDALTEKIEQALIVCQYPRRNSGASSSLTE